MYAVVLHEVKSLALQQFFSSFSEKRNTFLNSISKVCLYIFKNGASPAMGQVSAVPSTVQKQSIRGAAAPEISLSLALSSIGFITSDAAEVSLLSTAYRTPKLVSRCYLQEKRSWAVGSWSS